MYTTGGAPMSALRSGTGRPHAQRCGGKLPRPMKPTAAVTAKRDHGSGKPRSIGVYTTATAKHAATSSSAAATASLAAMREGSAAVVQRVCKSKSIAPTISCQKRDGRR